MCTGISAEQAWAGGGEEGSGAARPAGARSESSYPILSIHLSVSTEMCFSQSQMTKPELNCGQMSINNPSPAEITMVCWREEEQTDILEENLVQNDKFLCWLQTGLSIIQPSEFEIVPKRGE